jgi:hypothetical protein
MRLEQSRGGGFPGCRFWKAIAPDPAQRRFFRGFIRELFGQDAPQLLTVALASEVARAGGVVKADNFQALGPNAAEALDSEGEAVLGIVGDGDDAAGDVATFRSQVKQRLFRISGDFPGQRRHRGEAAAVFADFDSSGDEDILEASAQILGQIHSDSLI